MSSPDHPEDSNSADGSPEEGGAGSSGTGSSGTGIGAFTATGINGQEVDLSAYDDQVVLVVNTASKCGFTPQYQGLQKLQETYGAQGFTVLGFPCDQFAHQEPGDEEQIADFCSDRFGVTFPMFAKVDVNGKDAHPLYQWLRSQQKGLLGSSSVKWNFTKFLVSRQGEVLARFAPRTTPEELAGDIEKALGS